MTCATAALFIRPTLARHQRIGADAATGHDHRGPSLADDHDDRAKPLFPG